MILKKGTIIKHGTSFSRIDSIYKKGILPGFQRNIIRESIEDAPIVNGVYVADNLSFFGAYAAFSSFMYEHKNKKEKKSDIPIILHVELGEDCTLLADEDYLNIKNFEEKNKKDKLSLLEEHSNSVWSIYRTGVILGKGIPSNWIRKIEYPSLKNIYTLRNNDKYMEDFNQDIMLLVLAYWQTKTQATVSEFNHMLAEYQIKNKYHSEFTNKKEFSLKSINDIKKLSVMKKQNKKHEYAMFLWIMLTEKLNQLGLSYEN